MSMKVDAELRLYEKDGDETDTGVIRVQSHWNRHGINGLVCLWVDGRKYTVATQDLMEAVKRCSGF